ncbi:alpha-2,3 sialyltransferase [Helicobacter saguini]|uniref:Alpha-2,3 sialyltransferase n=1 Tax=Helicobacter saguini TaxID=1548018 RepID=A0A4U8SZ84_9HELI|nr:alpha-2,3-sialyltransferase [Helicobacter saguini]MWV67595.1 alpha-2,3 sialyltransferase [Helicobacter saguini]TLD92379.1 alpha-2,3 sialyltransferase [Helicobacter saguini]
MKVIDDNKYNVGGGGNPILESKIDSRKIIIAGNGPSVKEIDYKRMPLDCDIYRCSQFYFEDKYYLGKKIKGVNSVPFAVYNQFYNLCLLLQNKEYFFEELIMTGMPEEFKSLDDFKRDYPNAIIGYKLLERIPAYFNYINFYELYFGQRPTSAVQLCAIAVARGYKEIYVVGIDFYEKGQYSYFYDFDKTNLGQFLPKYDITERECHNKTLDINALVFLQEHYNVNIYSLCPNSPFSKYFPLAPNIDSNFVVESKSEHNQTDIIIPNLQHVKSNKNRFKEINSLKHGWRNNIYYKIFKDLFRLPSDVKNYLKAKKI